MGLINRVPECLRPALQTLKFEVQNWRARRSQRRRSFDQEYLQLGCDIQLLPGFLNTDVIQNREADFPIDARYPLPLKDEEWKGIYSHHFLEHISFEAALKLFDESFRILKPGGTFRVVVPDGEKVIKLYMQPDAMSAFWEVIPEWFHNEKWHTPMEIVNYYFRDNNYNKHEFMWDYETLNYYLLAAGFREVRKLKLNEAKDPQMSGHDKVAWEKFSLYVEAEK